MAKTNIHACNLKLDSFGLRKLPPNASCFRRLGRNIRKFLTLNPNSRSAKRFFRNKSTMIAEQKRHLQGSPFVIHPFSDFNRVRKTIFCVLWTMEMIISPIYMSFVQVEKGWARIIIYQVVYRRKHQTYKDDLFFNFYTLVLSPLEACCALLFFCTGYINPKTKEIVLEPTKIVKHYLRTYYIIDYLMNMKFGIYTKSTRLMYLINMTCMLRAGTVFKYLKEIVLNFKMREEVHDCLRLVVATFIILNSFACFYYYIPWIFGGENFPTNSWPIRSNISIGQGVSVSLAYTESLLCVVCYFFGTSEGQIDTDLDDVLQKVMLITIMVFGRMWTLYVIACILKIFSVVTISETKYEEYLQQLEVYMRQKRLPQVLRNRMLEYYKYKYQYHFFNERAIFATLSSYLRQELMLFGARKLVNKVELFRVLPRSVVGAIIGSAKQIVYLPNDFIATRGSRADRVFFISSGTVAVINSNDEELAHLEDGDELGLTSAFQSHPYIYNYSYYTVETTEVYCITKKDFRNLIFDKDDMLKYFAKKVQNKIDVFRKVEFSYQVHGFDLLSELSSGRILERPRLRPTLETFNFDG